jgi:hypothetical protein
MAFTQELVNLLCEAGVEYIYADTGEETLKPRDGLISPAGCEIKRDINGHYNHFHINISYP